MKMNFLEIAALCTLTTIALSASPAIEAPGGVENPSVPGLIGLGVVLIGFGVSRRNSRPKPE
jgi:hypothetical protein